MNSIYTLPLFVDATDDEMQWLISHSYEMRLEKGEYFFREGEPARRFYVVLEGELQITRTIQGEKVVLGTTPRGIMGGETFLLSGTPAASSAQALVPSTLLVFDFPAFLAIFTNCPSVGVKILQTAAERMTGFATFVKQQEKMAALGKLSAGLAHELNNPAAAAKRSTGMLRTLLPAYQARTLALNVAGLSTRELEELTEFVATLQQKAQSKTPLSTLAQSEQEDEIGTWLEQFEVENCWDMAAEFAGAHVTVADLERYLELVPDTAATAPSWLAWLCESLTISSLLNEIEQSTRRISDLVGAIKGYTYMDRDNVQEVDIHKDLENTLLVLRHKMGGTHIVREYDPELPRIQGRGDELNQVWTNLIDNAIDALKGQGEIRLITRCENNFVMVEVSDNGPGIPPEVQPRIFEPFFTTKDVGSGTGLGLDISYRVIQQHNGTIQVESQPGKTRFIIRLPIHGVQG